MALKCVKSILEQDVKDFEIIIIDDASSDNTCKDLRKNFGKYNKIKIICTEREIYKSACVNIALSIARGYFIVIVDDDNILLPSLARRLLEFMVERKDAACAGTIGIDLEKRTIWSSGVSIKFPGFHRRAKFDIMPYEVSNTPNVFMFRRILIKYFGGFDHKVIPFQDEDEEWILRIKYLTRSKMKCFIVPNAITIHPEPKLETRISPMRIYFLARSKPIIIRRYKPLWMSFLLLIWPIYIMRIMIQLWNGIKNLSLRDRIMYMNIFTRGAIDGITAALFDKRAYSIPYPNVYNKE
jgi:glycosyltransferase involved in cell wall biosynthesis